VNMGDHLRIVTLNIRHGMDVCGEIRLDVLGEKLALLDADVICLQEVDMGVGRSGGVNQAEVLASYTHRVSIFSSAFEYDGGLYGISILMRSNPTSMIQMALPQLSPVSEPRRALIVELSNKIGLANLHLSRDIEEAQMQASWLGEHLPDWVSIICGDFNLSLAHLAFESTGWVSVFAPGREPFTWPADKPENSLDHILVRTQSWACVSAKTCTIFPTDHLAIVADLRRILKEE